MGSVVAGEARTPIGGLPGQLKDLSATDLGGCGTVPATGAASTA